MVVVHAPEYITAISADIEVLCLFREHQCVYRQMSLDKATVSLCLHHLQLYFFWWNTQVHPRGHLRHFQAFFAIEQELSNDLLHPGCP